MSYPFHPSRVNYSYGALVFVGLTPRLVGGAEYKIKVMNVGAAFVFSPVYPLIPDGSRRRRASPVGGSSYRRLPSRNNCRSLTKLLLAACNLTIISLKLVLWLVSWSESTSYLRFEPQTVSSWRGMSGGGRNKLPGLIIAPLIFNANGHNNLAAGLYAFSFQCLATDLEDVLSKRLSFVAVDIPLTSLIPHLTIPELRHTATVHGSKIRSTYSAAQAKEALMQHSCDTCPRILSIMDLSYKETALAAKNARAYSKRKNNSNVFPPSAAFALKVAAAVAKSANTYRYLRKAYGNTLPGGEFPPKPPSFEALHGIISRCSEAVQPDRFIEAGCAVCGDLEILRGDGVTRKERHCTTDPIEELPGVILADGCIHICVECEGPLRKHQVPIFSLANYCWVGKVPPQLQDLTYAEGVMIARVRHNRCVMRVNSGRVRMHANAIMFPQPALKVYLKLPPSREEMGEVLAFIFTGSAAPTEEDFERTPMLVRRQKVSDALDWLKLNHSSYADLEISVENLNSYKLRDVPVVVDFKRTESKADDSIPAEARSVNDSNEEHGTTSGQCTWAVHGLTGAEFSKKSMSQIKNIAIQHLMAKGSMLAIGRGDEPVSMYDEGDYAYPGMFPWLFPYGKGGMRQAVHKNRVSDMTRKRNMLLYHDKRFQVDMYFPMVAFNHEQLKGSAVGANIMVKRSKFADVSRRLLATNQEVAGNLADRMAAGEHVNPTSDAEKQCFSLLTDLDGIGAHVMGSATSKKHMRNEIWSTTAFVGAPTWFLTMAWADVNHPLALYYAQTDTTYRPELLKCDERYKLMSKNPVSAARFFHYMVLTFLEDVLGWKSESPGLYGHTNAYYGTVEQQGRLTLHLHLLLWIMNALSPQQIRDRIMSKDSVFQKKLIVYLEAAHQGDFTHGTMQEVRHKVKTDPQATAAEIDAQCTPTYKVPTLTLPTVPPPLCKVEHGDEPCDACTRLSGWWTDYEHEVDDLWLRSNVHTCRESIQDKSDQAKKKDWRHISPVKREPARTYWERRGCLSKTGICKARFPRDLYESTHVDQDGHINIKKTEPYINTVSKVLTYWSRSNTDVTSLLSGTAVKAVVSYVSDYVSKLGLKTYQAFASVYDVFERNAETLSNSGDSLHTSKTLMRQMINSMSTKLEIGSPMAAMYVLGNPDHYKSHEFVNFPWRSYVTFVKNFWCVKSTEEGEEDQEDYVTIRRRNGDLVAASVVDDYRFRPMAYESLNLYEWIQSSEKKARTKGEKKEFLEQEALHDAFNAPPSDDGDSDAGGDDGVSSCGSVASDLDDFMDRDLSSDEETDASYFSDDDSDWNSDDDDETIVEKETKKRKAYRLVRHAFLPEHKAMYKTHTVHCDFRKFDTVIPNFLGGAVPRADKGDREYYCLAMMTLFKPWRSAGDLKDQLSNWDQVFVEYKFTDRQQQLIANFNLRYECNDTRDDHYAIMQQKLAARQDVSGHPTLGTKDVFLNDQDDLEYDDSEVFYGDDTMLGERTKRLKGYRDEIREVLVATNWLADSKDGLLNVDTDRYFAPTKPRRMWAQILITERKLCTLNKLADMPAGLSVGKVGFTNDKVEIVGHDHMTPGSKMSKDASAKLISDICSQYSLNQEQERAFRLVADHAAGSPPAPLKMYLGGMGGSGKSVVFKAIISFFTARKEEYRFIVLGPTGSTAALLNGSTYHSVFKIPRESKSKNQDDIDGMPNDAASMAAVNDRIQGVEYILLDEISMVSCADLQTLASQAGKARSIHDQEFGGLSVILAGDFAQLPPTSGSSLYSQKVGLKTEAQMGPMAQKSVLGRVLWHQFTTVVILRQNMRQTSQAPLDAKLRTALENMRYCACTPDDIEFLRSRVASNRPGFPKLDTKKYRNVSVITAWNVHKDAINEIGPERFAKDTGQQLVDFFSIDTLSTRAAERKWTKCEQTRFRSLGPNLQKALWKASPSTTTEHIPGTLRLCVGMPVMIKSNEATELCITKGQEGTVVGWDENVGPSNQRVLDTLFVKLTNPPRPIQIPDLPLNVVPLPRKSTFITALLEDDSLLALNREQVLVLPNFSMTDYGSQGKSRDPNVVHLNNCNTHKGYYVALSRGHTAENTVIVQGFDPNKITKGLDGHLRQEFRELELLDEITRLRHENRLPLSVQGMYRGQLLASYKKWKGDNAPDPAHFHPALKLVKDDDNTTTDYTEWRTSSKQGKRKREDDKQKPPSAKKAKTEANSGALSKTPIKAPITSIVTEVPGQVFIRTPIGLIWDSTNYSCGYDAFLTPLGDLWRDDPVTWTRRLSGCSRLLGLWSIAMTQTSNPPEFSRDILRQMLNMQDSTSFPTGPRTIRLDPLFMAMTDRRSYGDAITHCEQCLYQQTGTVSTFGQFVEIYSSPPLRRAYPQGMRLSEWFARHFYELTHISCPDCRFNGSSNKLRRSTVVHGVPDVLLLGIGWDKISIDPAMAFRHSGGTQTMRLRGLIYHANVHFTCVVIDKEGNMWYHDGITTGRKATFIGRLKDVQNYALLHEIRGQKLGAVMYARD